MRNALSSSLVVLVLVSCGGKTPPPLKPDPSDAVVDAGAPKAAAPAADAGGTAETPPAPSAAAAAPAASAPTEPPDACTPIGVDFEQRARPKLKECYRDGKKKDPDLKGTVRITVDINTLGKIKAYTVVEKTLPDPVVACMLKVVKATPFPEASKCGGKLITIPMTFPSK